MFEATVFPRKYKPRAYIYFGPKNPLGLIWGGVSYFAGRGRGSCGAGGRTTGGPGWKGGGPKHRNYGVLRGTNKVEVTASKAFSPR